MGVSFKVDGSDDFEIIANGLVLALVAGIVARMGVSFEVNGGDNFETVANGFVSALVVGTIANWLGFFLSAMLGFLLIGDGFISSYWSRWSKPSQMGWVSSYRRRLGFFSSAMLGFLLIGDSFFWNDLKDYP